MKQNEDAAPESLPTEAMTQAFARVFDVRDQAGTFGPALRAALTAVGRAPMQQDSGLKGRPWPGSRCCPRCGCSVRQGCPSSLLRRNS